MQKYRLKGGKELWELRAECDTGYRVFKVLNQTPYSFLNMDTKKNGKITVRLQDASHESVVSTGELLNASIGEESVSLGTVTNICYIPRFGYIIETKDEVSSYSATENS